MINPAIRFIAESSEEEQFLVECSEKIIKNIDRNIARGNISDKELNKYLSIRWYLYSVQSIN